MKSLAEELDLNLETFLEAMSQYDEEYESLAISDEELNGCEELIDSAEDQG